jgi:sensor histidine kinase YesM
VTWPTKVGPIAAHLNLSVLIGVVHAMVHSGAGWTFGLRPSTLAFAEYFESTLLDWLPISVLTYWAIIAVTRGLIYYEELREEQVRAATLSRQLSEARLEALSAQLHPHFLFNTLNSAVALIRTEDSLRAVDVLTHLGDILRHLLRAAPSQEISLADELSFLQRYLDIERIRFQHRLTTSLDVPADTMDASVPSLILQPLVENAIHHGLDTHDEAIRIELAAGVAQGVLVLTVRDDGPGLPEGWSERRSTGVGLANVRARLEHLYGSVARLEIRGRPRGGVEAKITMPFIRIVRPDIEPEVVG